MMRNWPTYLLLLAFPATAGLVGYFAGAPLCTSECAPTTATQAALAIEAQTDHMFDELAKQIIIAATPGYCPEEAMRRAGTALCFAPGTPPEVIEAFTRRMMIMEIEFDGDGGAAYQLVSRWSGTQGSPRALTWSFIPNGVSIPGGAGESTSACNLFTTLDSQFANNGGRSVWVAKFQQCFDRWQTVTGLSYTRVMHNGNDWDDGAAWGSSGSAGLRGDVRIGMHFIDGGSGVLAWNQFPSQGGDMCLDSGDTWDGGSGDYRFLRNTVMHEHGHGIGLAHSCPGNSTKLMEPLLNTNFDGPQHDDIRGAQWHYGDARESNGTAATATDLGTLSPGGQILNYGNITNPVVNNSSLVAINRENELDWYSFTITAPLSVTITVAPRGLLYDQSQQNANGTCASGNNNNSIDEANLTVDLIDRNGVTVLATANSQPAGSNEVIPSTSLSVVGTYYVRVSESATVSQTQMYVMTLDASCAGPGITTQPQSASVCSGESVSFTVAASGTGLTYQWRRNGVNISGATNPTYTDLNVQPADAGNYDCVVSNSCGSTTSDTAVLTVTESINFTTHPQSQSVCAGDAAGFSVTVTGGAPITYQWQRNGVNIPGAIGPTYNVLSASQSNAGTYRCVVTNPCGTVNSNNAVLTVTDEAYIVTQPTSQSACLGGSATFTVVADGTNPTYQWRFNGSNIPGATSASYTDNNVQPGDAGNYDVVVSNSCGTETSVTVTLTIVSAPGISQHPSSQSVCEGAGVSFSVTATGSGLSYQWQKDGNNIGGATGSSYTIVSTTAGDAGSYRCVVTNACGSVNSNPATLTINTAPTISQHPQDQQVCEGSPVSFSVTAGGSPAPTYQWRRNTVNIGGATSATYQIPAAAPGDVGSYDCVVTNACGSVVSNAATLTIGGQGPQITQHPQSTAACTGATVTFTITVSGGNPSYQWRKDGNNIPSATNSSYQLTGITLADQGSYDCVVTDTCGSTTSNAATLTVGLKGDANCDGSVNNFDIDAFVFGLVEGEAAWSALYPCDFLCSLDVNNDGNVDNFDIDLFVICVLNGGCP